MLTVRALESPVTASAVRLVGTPGREIGAKEREPSRVEVSLEVWVARS